MHFFIYFLSLLLVALSTDGLGLPPGWWCGTKPCDAGMKEMEDSRINDRAVSNTTATDTAVNNTAVNNTAVTGRPIVNMVVPSCSWWCAVKKRQINNLNISNEASAVRPSRQTIGRKCGEGACPLDLETLKNDNTNNTAINNTAVTTTPIHHNSPQGWCGWYCRANKHQIQQDKYQQESEHEAPDRLSSI